MTIVNCASSLVCGRGILLAFVVTVVAFCLSYVLGRVSYYFKVRNLPLAHDLNFFDRWFTAKGISQFIGDFTSLRQKGFAKNENAFRVQTDLGEVIVLAPHYATEIREDNGLSAGVYTNIVRARDALRFVRSSAANILPISIQELMGFLPGMEAFAFAGTHRGLMHDAITKQLNRSLPQLISSLSAETADCLKTSWGDDYEWHAVSLYQTALLLVAQVSTRAFLGPDMSKNQRWVEINSQYTVVGLGAVMALRWWPRYLLPLIHRFHPKVRATRALLAEAREIMHSIREKRKQDKHREVNSMDWFDEVASQRGDQYDPAVAQLTFAVAAMHSTTDQLCQVLLDLRNHPDVVDALRRELVDTITREGWKQAAFNQLKLMDSVLKESQRLKPINQVFNKRAVLKDLELSNGVCLPKGSFIAVSAHRMRDPAVYPEPDKFDAYRFIERANNDPEKARFCGFSSVSIDHTGFGFGKHACPGRTYVTLELKILLAHILLKYDWKLPEGVKPNFMNHGFDSLTDVTASLLVKRRGEELELPA
ncbi:Fumitremorgin C monooxygenase 4 [Colletotrichum chlorophyti]|uniref:Fumitremorgin C monooxygenase 4 n=1 Tax=Colletotrichum chlorophyti TaxID=708187 RepID=A0A1Q8S686_9PEZI|nr:Fumitremorgin C monooxygenase 4 [Colletotrichum chlorophyti]